MLIFLAYSVYPATGECQAGGWVCECFPGFGGEVCQPWGLHPHPDKAAAVVEAADHPCLAPIASKNQGHSPQPQVSDFLTSLFTA